MIEGKIVDNDEILFENLGKPIAHGRRSEIFGLGYGRILKLYYLDFPLDLIEREFYNTKIVNQTLGELVPRVFSLVTVGQRHGIVFQKIDGSSFMDLYQKNPLLYFTTARLLSDIHRRIHSHQLPELSTQQEVFCDLLTNSDQLSSSEKQLLVDILNHPQQEQLCHGDFHHGNIIQIKDGIYVVLDWMDAFSGDPALDIALTAVNAAVSDAPPHIPGIYRQLYNWLKKALVLDDKIFCLYPEISQDRWPPVVALAAGIHLARKEGDKIDHRRYFEQAMKAIKP